MLSLDLRGFAWALGAVCKVPTSTSWKYQCPHETDYLVIFLGSAQWFFFCGSFVFSILFVSGVFFPFSWCQVCCVSSILFVSGLFFAFSWCQVCLSRCHVIFFSMSWWQLYLIPFSWCQVWFFHCFGVRSVFFHCFGVRSVFLSILLVSGLLMHSISVRSVFPFSWCQVCPFPCFFSSSSCLGCLVCRSVCPSVCIAAYSERNGTRQLVGSLLVCLICGSCLVLCCPVIVPPIRLLVCLFFVRLSLSLSISQSPSLSLSLSLSVFLLLSHALSESELKWM